MFRSLILAVHKGLLGCGKKAFSATEQYNISSLPKSQVDNLRVFEQLDPPWQHRHFQHFRSVGANLYTLYTGLTITTTLI
jgi:hypothetical protein